MIGELLVRNLPAGRSHKPFDLLSSRYRRVPAVITSNRGRDDCPMLPANAVVFGAALLYRLIRRGAPLEFEGKSRSFELAAACVAKNPSAN